MRQKTKCGWALHGRGESLLIGQACASETSTNTSCFPFCAATKLTFASKRLGVWAHPIVQARDFSPPLPLKPHITTLDLREKYLNGLWWGLSQCLHSADVLLYAQSCISPSLSSKDLYIIIHSYTSFQRQLPNQDTSINLGHARASEQTKINIPFSLLLPLPRLPADPWPAQPICNSVAATITHSSGPPRRQPGHTPPPTPPVKLLLHPQDSIMRHIAVLLLRPTTTTQVSEYRSHWN